MPINLRSTVLATICSLGLSLITTSILSARRGPPDLSKLSSEQQAMIANACGARQFRGRAMYYRCLRDQLRALRNSSGEPDLSDLSSEEQAMIASACNVARQFDGPAKYYGCLRDQLGALRSSSGEPDLSDLSPEQQEMIFNACRGARQFIGPASYYNCLRSQRVGLGAQIAPVTDPGTPAVSPPAHQPTSNSPKTGSGATPGLQTNPGIPSSLIVLGAVIFVSLFLLEEVARRGKKCFSCGARTTNATQICDSCRERTRAEENWRRGDQTPCGSFNPYEVLGVSQGASREEIRSAYRELIARYHPDKVAHLGQEFEAIAREKTLAINRAYEMLASL